MPNDGAVVPQVFDLRARIEDDGNSAATGLKVLPVAGIDPERHRRLHPRRHANQVLIVDTDGDGYCDHINPLLVPTTQPPTQNNQVLKVRLAGVPGQGDADYRDDSNPALELPVSARRDCRPKPSAPATSRSSPSRADDNLPVIYSVEPITKARCMGAQFDTMANHITDGWACMAVQSTDNSGNTSVSPPLRVYINHTGTNARKQASAGRAWARRPRAREPTTRTRTRSPPVPAARAGSTA